MKALQRWWRFNAVGAMGMLVQLTALRIISHRPSGHYLLASAVALELTLLHNFVWHVHFTWRDRCKEIGTIVQLVRFHLSNGLVSMVGNLAIMRVLVKEAHWSILAADSVAILCCSLVNFYLSDRWTFDKAQAAWAS